MATLRLEKKILRVMLPGQWYCAYELGTTDKSLWELVGRGCLVAAAYRQQTRFRLIERQREMFTSIGDERRLQ